MGNKQKNSDKYSTPIKSKTKSNYSLSNSNNKLYSDEKQFKNIDNSNLLGFKLLEEVDSRYFYLSCPNCCNYTLDLGFDKNIECGFCHKYYDADLQASFMKEDKTMKTEERMYLTKLNSDIKELTDLVLIVDKDTLLSQFIEDNSIDYPLIIQKLLLPFFKIKQRIIKEDYSFKIGDILFKVSGLNPFKFGFVSSNTYIRLNNFFTAKLPIQRALLLTSKYLLNFSDKDLIEELHSEPFQIIKNEICKVKKFEFFIKNCEPESGIVDKDTLISIENKQLSNITKIQLGVIKNNTPIDFDFEEEINYQQFIHQQIYKPYFLSGVRRYIERGDVVKIDNIEMFVLNSLPENGFITQNTQVYYKYNMSKDQCLDKINKLDMKYAMQIAQSDSNDSNYLDFDRRIEFDSNNRLVINSNNINDVITRILNRDANDREVILNEMRRRRDYLSSGEMINLSALQLSSQPKEHSEEDIEMFINCLPELVVDKEYFEYITSKKKTIEENISKCMICFDDFGVSDILKTLPCSK